MNKETPEAEAVKEENAKGANTMKFNLNFKADTPTASNRIYPKDVLKRAFDEAIQDNLWLTSRPAKDGSVVLEDIIGVCTSYDIHKDNTVELDIQPMGNLSIQIEDLNVSTQGLGRVDPETNEVKAYKILHLFLEEKKSNE